MRVRKELFLQVYEDSLELQQFFMRTRDELCKNGEVLLTPALSFTELHFQKALEKERLDRTSKVTHWCFPCHTDVIHNELY